MIFIGEKFVSAAEGMDQSTKEREYYILTDVGIYRIEGPSLMRVNSEPEEPRHLEFAPQWVIDETIEGVFTDGEKIAVLFREGLLWVNLVPPQFGGGKSFEFEVGRDEYESWRSDVEVREARIY